MASRNALPIFPRPWSESTEPILRWARILPGVEVQLVGSDQKPVADGEVGELWVRGPNVMKGYYRAPEETAAAINSGGMVQHPRPCPAGKRISFYRWPNQGIDRSLWRECLPGGSRGGAERASRSRALRSHWADRSRERKAVRKSLPSCNSRRPRQLRKPNWRNTPRNISLHTSGRRKFCSFPQCR